LSKTYGVTAHTTATLNDVVCGGDQDARKKFITYLTTLIGKPKSATGYGSLLVKYFLELVLDNVLIEIQNAADLAVSYGYSVSIQITRIYTTTTTREVTGGGDGPHMKFDSTVTISNEPTDEDFGGFISKALEVLVQAKIFETSAANNILFTFGVKGANTLANIAGGQAISTGSISTSMKCGGDQLAAAKFIKLITPILGQKTKLSSVAIYLLQLILDNVILELQDAAQLAVSFRIAVSIEGTSSEDAETEVIPGHTEIQTEAQIIPGKAQIIKIPQGGQLKVPAGIDLKGLNLGLQ